MGFMAGFAEVLVDQEKARQAQKDKETQATLEHKLRVDEEEQSYYRKKQLEEGEYKKKAEWVASQVGNPAFADTAHQFIANGVDPIKVIELYNDGRFEQPASAKTVLPSTVDEPLPAPNKPVVDTTVPKKIGDSFKLPKAVTDLETSATTDAQRQPTDLTKDVKISGETETNTPTTEEDATVPKIEQTPIKSRQSETEDEQITQVAKNVDSTFRLKPAPKKFEMGTFEEENIKLLELKNSPMSNKADIAQQEARVGMLKQLKAEADAAKAKIEGKNLVYRTRINKNTGQIIDVAAYEQDAKGNPLGADGLPKVLGSNEKWGPADENTIDHIIKVKEKYLPQAEKLNGQISSFASAVEIGRRMNEITARPENAGVLTRPVGWVETVKGFGRDWEQLQTMFLEEKRQMSADPSGKIDPAKADSYYKAAMEAANTAEGILPTITDETTRVGMLRTLYDNYQIAFAYKLAAVQGQQGREVTNKDFEQFMKQAGGTTDPKKASYNISQMLQVQLSYIEQQKQVFNDSIKAFSEGMFPEGSSPSFNVPRWGNIFSGPGQEQNALYMNSLTKELETKKKYTQEDFDKSIGIEEDETIDWDGKTLREGDTTEVLRNGKMIPVKVFKDPTTGKLKFTPIRGAQ